MSALRERWFALCSKLNVKPKQFGILLLLTLGAVGVLGLKMTVLKPKKASARTVATKAKARAKASPATPGKSAPVEDPAVFSTTLVGLPVVQVAFESRPTRDPFEPFFVYKPDPVAEPEELPLHDGQGVAVHLRPGQGSGSGTSGKAAEPEAPSPPQGLTLKAIISGRVAVLNTMNVERGDVIQDSTGRYFTVEAIRERSVILNDGTRSWPVGYAPAPTGSKTGPSKR